MPQSRYDFFVAKPNSGETRHCLACGSECGTVRNVFGPTGWAAAMAGHFTNHDEFVCPHTNEPWHHQAVRLAMAIADSPSKRVAEMMRADRKDLVRENLPG